MKITVDIPTSPPAVPARTQTRTLTVAHPGGTTTAKIVTVTPEEMIASKAAAVFGRKQPRDAYDVWAATTAGLTTAQQAASLFHHYRTPGWSLGRATLSRCRTGCPTRRAAQRSHAGPCRRRSTGAAAAHRTSCGASHGPR